MQYKSIIMMVFLTAVMSGLKADPLNAGKMIPAMMYLLSGTDPNAGYALGNMPPLDRADEVSDLHTVTADTDHPIDSQEVDDKVDGKFGEDTSSPVFMDADQKAFVGNWFGRQNYLQIRLQLKADGSYRYFEYLGIGKYHNIGRVLRYDGDWSLQNGNSQLVLNTDASEVPIILSARYPNLVAASGITLWGGSGIDRNATMQVDTDQDTSTISIHRQKVQNVFSRNLRGEFPDYFTMVAAKANSESFWSAAGIEPPGYNYGHKIYKPFVPSDTQVWEYAVDRNKHHPKDYAVVISDESWTVFMGHRANFESAIMDPHKLYRWFFYWKTEMQILGNLKNGVIQIFAGDPPPYFMKEIRKSYDNNAANVPANIAQSRFPDAMELNPPQTFAGIFQVMDYIRMKYAPNVRMGFTLKEWGSQGLSDTEPEDGWQSDPELQDMADELNSLGVCFEYLGFNFNPSGEGGRRSDEIYKVRAKYFGTVAAKLVKRDGNTPAGAKAWIWKSSLWSNHPSFYFRNIRFLVNQANIAGMTLGHGNDWSGNALDDYADPAKDWPLKSWIEEYYTGQSKNLSPEGTIGKVYLP